MTRPQYLALCVIGAVAGLAYLQAYRTARAVQALAGGGTVRGSASSLIV
jgi:hypothetical protein